MNEKQVIIVGSLARDRIEAGGSVHHRVGGVVWYAGTTFASFGIKTCVVTRTTSTDKDLVQAVRDVGVEVKWRPSTSTTTFVNRYFDDNPDGRVQNVTALAEPIEAEQLLEALVGVHVVYLGPLHAEDVADDTLQALRIHRPPFVALDAQGYTRAVRAGRVIPKLDHRLLDILNFCDVVKANQEELRLISGVRELPEAALSLATAYPDLEIVVTCGAKGAYVVQRDEVHYEPAVPVDISDPTGAGDVYFASYLAKRFFAKLPGEASIKRASEFAANYTSGYLADRCSPKKGGPAASV